MAWRREKSAGGGRGGSGVAWGVAGLMKWAESEGEGEEDGGRGGNLHEFEEYRSCIKYQINLLVFNASYRSS